MSEGRTQEMATDIVWCARLADALVVARKLRLPILIKPANQGIIGELW